jgi:KipI family sensor histidine kinase inhibitor
VSGARPQIAPFGDAALLVSFGDHIDPRLNDRVHALAAAVADARACGVAWHAPVPAYASLLCGFDALLMSTSTARARLDELVGALENRPADGPPASTIEIPVRYGGDDGPDLTAVAERLGLTPAQVVELHASTTYRAYMLGFSPGFAYLGQLPAALELPRRSTPRQRVPRGSVAIAGRQTAIYPLVTPGGWHLLGRTELRLWDVERVPPALIAAGDSVRFVPLAA